MSGRKQVVTKLEEESRCEIQRPGAYLLLLLIFPFKPNVQVQSQEEGGLGGRWFRIGGPSKSRQAQKRQYAPDPTQI
jgi:hypothetical protein